MFVLVDTIADSFGIVAHSVWQRRWWLGVSLLLLFCDGRSFLGPTNTLGSGRIRKTGQLSCMSRVRAPHYPNDVIAMVTDVASPSRSSNSSYSKKKTARFLSQSEGWRNFYRKKNILLLNRTLGLSCLAVKVFTCTQSGKI